MAGKRNNPEEADGASAAGHGPAPPKTKCRCAGSLRNLALQEQLVNRSPTSQALR